MSYLSNTRLERYFKASSSLFVACSSRLNNLTCLILILASFVLLRDSYHASNTILEVHPNHPIAAFEAIFHYALSLVAIAFQATVLVMSVLMVLMDRKTYKSAVLFGFLCTALGWVFNVARISSPNLTLAIFLLTIAVLVKLNEEE